MKHITIILLFFVLPVFSFSEVKQKLCITPTGKKNETKFY
jgi:hypothetical protein